MAMHRCATTTTKTYVQRSIVGVSDANLQQQPRDVDDLNQLMLTAASAAVVAT